MRTLLMAGFVALAFMFLVFRRNIRRACEHSIANWVRHRWERSIEELRDWMDRHPGMHPSQTKEGRAVVARYLDRYAELVLICNWPLCPNHVRYVQSLGDPRHVNHSSITKKEELS